MSYWHRMPGTQLNDELQRDALEALGFRVVDIWEYEVNSYDKVNMKMREIIYGMPKSTGLKGAGFIFEKDERICPYCGDPDCVPYDVSSKVKD